MSTITAEYRCAQLELYTYVNIPTGAAAKPFYIRENPIKIRNRFWRDMRSRIGFVQSKHAGKRKSVLK